MLIFFGIHTANVVNLARRESVKLALAVDVLHMEPNFTVVIAPDVTENEKTALKSEPMIRKFN